MSLMLTHSLTPQLLILLLFFFNDPAPPEIYTLSLHDALPISAQAAAGKPHGTGGFRLDRRQRSDEIHSGRCRPVSSRDRKSTRLNSSHITISYAVFCLKKKKRKTTR